MSETKITDIVSRLRDTLKKDQIGSLTHEEVRTLARDTDELAKRLKKVRSRFPHLPAARLSPHIFKVLKEITERYRSAEPENIIRRAVNF